MQVQRVAICLAMIASVSCAIAKESRMSLQSVDELKALAKSKGNDREWGITDIPPLVQP